MIWTRSETIALANQKCVTCFGLGIKPGKAGTSSPCNCVFRAIFRACLQRFRFCSLSAFEIAGRARLEQNEQGRNQGKRHVWSRGMRNQEYAADFILTARRTLGINSRAYRIFVWHYLLGADFKLVNRKLGRAIDCRETFHDFYRIEQRLGRVFRELQPYALYPLDEYFGGVVRNRTAASEFPVVVNHSAHFPLKAQAA